MNTFSLKLQRALGSALLISISLMSMGTWAQTNPVTEKSAPLNLDDKNIAKELLKEDGAADNSSTNKNDRLETITVEPNELDASFKKAEKHGIIPRTVEINAGGAAQRVTKVTGPAGTYCVYSPTVARTDGVDEIQSGLQDQVRTCPP